MVINADLALLILRLVIGGLLAGHGAQKLFGWFDGPGLSGATESMITHGLRPAAGWGFLASGAEFAGGLLTLLGFLNPLGPIMIIADMVMAIALVHWGKPIWSTMGGGELPLTNIAVAAALILTGSGNYALDRLLGMTLPSWVGLAAAALGLLAIVVGLVSRTPLPSATAGAHS
jgi:putative oxidoreductase